MMVNLVDRLLGRKTSDKDMCADQVMAARLAGYDEGFEAGKQWSQNSPSRPAPPPPPRPSKQRLKPTAPMDMPPPPSKVPGNAERLGVGERPVEPAAPIQKTTVFDIALGMGIRIDTHTMARILEFSIVGGGANLGRPQLVGDLAAYLTVLGYAWIHGMHHDKFVRFPRGNRTYTKEMFVEGCSDTYADVQDMVKKFQHFYVIMPKSAADVLQFVEETPATLSSSPASQGANMRKIGLTSPFDPRAYTYHSSGMNTTLGFCRRYPQGYGSHSGMFHSGIDTARGRQTYGMDLFAVADGLVVFEGTGTGTFGHVLGLQHEVHGLEFICRYAHNSACLVSVGDRVSRGELVAKVGDGDGRWAAHCHNDFIKGSEAPFVRYGDTSFPSMDAVAEHYLNPQSLF